MYVWKHEFLIEIHELAYSTYGNGIVNCVEKKNIKKQ